MSSKTRNRLAVAIVLALPVAVLLAFIVCDYLSDAQKPPASAHDSAPANFKAVPQNSSPGPDSNNPVK